MSKKRMEVDWKKGITADDIKLLSVLEGIWKIMG